MLEVSIYPHVQLGREQYEPNATCARLHRHTSRPASLHERQGAHADKSLAYRPNTSCLIAKPPFQNGSLSIRRQSTLS